MPFESRTIPLAAEMKTGSTAGMHFGFIFFFGYLLFFLMLFSPTVEGTLKVTKAILVVFVTAIALASVLLRRKIGLHRSVFMWTLSLVTAGLVFMLIGALNSAPGALRVGTVFVLWPLFFTLIAGCIRNEKVNVRLSQVMVIATIAISIYGFLFFLSKAGVVPSFSFLELYELGKQGVRFNKGYIETSIPSLASLLFLLPFIVATLMRPSGSKLASFSRFIQWVAFLLGVSLVVISARKALQLIVLISPFATLFFELFLPKNKKSRRASAFFKIVAFSILILIGLSFYLGSKHGFSFDALLNVHREAFSVERGIGGTERTEQFFALVDGWASSPILGSGLGAVARGPLRSADMPWAYELSYLAFLFHTGLIGFIAYSSAVAWLYWMGIRMIHSGDGLGDHMLPILVGMTCFLIANATNPYLAKFDFMWVIFLPIAFVNQWLLAQGRRGLQAIT